MKHVVRLLVVLIIVCGIGFGIFALVNKNAPFVVETFVINQNKSNQEAENNIDVVKQKMSSTSLNYDKYSQNYEIYKSIKNGLVYAENLLSSTSLNAQEANIIKNGFKDFGESLKDLNAALVSLKAYLDLPSSEQNDTELAGRENKANEKFNIVISEFLKLNDDMFEIGENKIYAGKSYDPEFNLVRMKNILTNASLSSSMKNADLVISMNAKIELLNQNKDKIDNEMVKFVVLYNKYTKAEWQTCFNEYFESDEYIGGENKVSFSDFNLLLSYINKEAYYEKV